MATLYPLRLKPVLKDYLWGGTGLATKLGKPIPKGKTRAESWEAVDHPDGQSVVENGPLAGKTLGELADQYPEELYGQSKSYDRFPLLLKYLDANKTLSVQVHPNDDQGAELTPPDLGKTEAWLVVSALPGSLIYAGLREGVGMPELAVALERGNCDKCLHAFEPTAGDCVFIPAGTVHALGAGLVIAEIQQASNTTFRLFDWNRVDKEGKSRPLHIEESLKVTDFSRGPVMPQQPEQFPSGWQRLVSCDKFIFDRFEFSEANQSAEVESNVGFRILTVVSGSVKIMADGEEQTLDTGQTLLVPACTLTVSATADAEATLLAMRLP